LPELDLHGRARGGAVRAAGGGRRAGGGKGMIVTAGIDVGTSAVKVVVLESAEGGGRAREGARARAMVSERIRRRDQREVVRRAWGAALEAAGVAAGDVQYIATTGEGEDVDFRTGHFYGMTAHARGAIFLDPGARAVVDVGALH